MVLSRTTYVRDNTTKKSFYFTHKKEAVEAVKTRYADHHKLAIGLMQISTSWLQKLHIQPETLLDPCSNIKYGTLILARNYLDVKQNTNSTHEALSGAISSYWSGNAYTGGVYVNQVYKNAGSGVRVAETAGVTDGILVSSNINKSSKLSNNKSKKMASNNQTDDEIPYRPAAENGSFLYRLFSR